MGTTKLIEHLGLDVGFLVSLADRQKILTGVESFVIQITYPVKEPVMFLHKILTGEDGLTFADLLILIGDDYKTIFADPEKYGVYGHSIDDLTVTNVLWDDDSNIIMLQVES